MLAPSRLSAAMQDGSEKVPRSPPFNLNATIREPDVDSLHGARSLSSKGVKVGEGSLASLHSRKSMRKSFRSSPLAGPALNELPDHDEQQPAAAEDDGTDTPRSRRASSFVPSQFGEISQAVPFLSEDWKSAATSNLLRRRSQPALPKKTLSPPPSPSPSIRRPALTATHSSPSLHVISESDDPTVKPRASSFEGQIGAYPSRSLPNSPSRASFLQAPPAAQLRLGQRTTMDARVRGGATSPSRASTSSGLNPSHARPTSAVIIMPAPPPPLPPTPPRPRPGDNSWYIENAYATTPRFSRLAAQGIVMPLSAKEYKKKVGSTGRPQSTVIRASSTQVSVSGRAEQPAASVSRKASFNSRRSVSISRVKRFLPSIRSIPSVPSIVLTHVPPDNHESNNSQGPYSSVLHASSDSALDLNTPASAPVSMRSPTNSEDTAVPSLSSSTTSSASSIHTLYVVDSDQSSRTDVNDIPKSASAPGSRVDICLDVDIADCAKPSQTPAKRQSLLRRMRSWHWSIRRRRAPAPAAAAAAAGSAPS